MTNPEKKFPGLKGMLITSLVVFILVVAWITVSVDGAQTPILNLVDTEPVRRAVRIFENECSLRPNGVSMTTGNTMFCGLSAMVQMPERIPETRRSFCLLPLTWTSRKELRDG